MWILRSYALGNTPSLKSSTAEPVAPPNHSVLSSPTAAAAHPPSSPRALNRRAEQPLRRPLLRRHKPDRGVSRPGYIYGGGAGGDRVADAGEPAGAAGLHLPRR